MEVRVAFDDPFLNHGEIVAMPPELVREKFALAPVTPQLVAQLIRASMSRVPWNFGGGPVIVRPRSCSDCGVWV